MYTPIYSLARNFLYISSFFRLESVVVELLGEKLVDFDIHIHEIVEDDAGERLIPWMTDISVFCLHLLNYVVVLSSNSGNCSSSSERLRPLCGQLFSFLNESSWILVQFFRTRIGRSRCMADIASNSAMQDLYSFIFLELLSYKSRPFRGFWIRKSWASWRNFFLKIWPEFLT